MVWELLDLLVLQARMVSLVLPEHRVHRVIQAQQEQLGLALLDLLVSPDQMGRLVLLV